MFEISKDICDFIDNIPSQFNCEWDYHGGDYVFKEVAHRLLQLGMGAKEVCDTLAELYEAANWDTWQKEEDAQENVSHV